MSAAHIALTRSMGKQHRLKRQTQYLTSYQNKYAKGFCQLSESQKLEVEKSR